MTNTTPLHNWTEHERLKRGLLNGSRVQLARESRGIARHTLARKLGIPVKELTVREQDWAFWTDLEQLGLGFFTKYPVAFFAQDDPPSFEVPTFFSGHDENGEPWCNVESDAR